MKFSGKIINKSGNKTVKVKIEQIVKNKKFHVNIKKYTYILVHDELNQAKVNDYVEVSSCAPYSAKKHFIITKYQ